MTAYASTADLGTYGLAAALANVPSNVQQSALDGCNALADGYLARRFVLPLTAWGADLRMQVCALAALQAITTGGFDPEDESAKGIVARAQAATKWFEGVAAGSVIPSGVVDSSAPPTAGAGRPRVRSSEPRGW